MRRFACALLLCFADSHLTSRSRPRPHARRASRGRYALHPVPATFPGTGHCQNDTTHFGAWPSYLNAEPITICENHSVIICALRYQHPRTSRRTGYFCWIRHAYHSHMSNSWHAFCDPTAAWDGNLQSPIFVDTFSRAHNHFAPNVIHKNVRPYLHVHGTALLPATARMSPDSGEVAYLLNGDQVTRPVFNPWHGQADLVNLFIVKRLLSMARIAGPDGAQLASNLSIYPMAGADGFGPGFGNYDVWRALAAGTVHPAPPPSPAPPRPLAASAKPSKKRVLLRSKASESGGRRLARLGIDKLHKLRAVNHTNNDLGVRRGLEHSIGVQIHRFPREAHQKRIDRKSAKPPEGRREWTGGQSSAVPDDLRPIAAAVLSPRPWEGPWWSMTDPMNKCPHRSEILHDFRRAVVPHLDATLPSGGVSHLLTRMKADHPNSTFLYQLPLNGNRTRQGLSAPRLPPGKAQLWPAHTLAAVQSLSAPPARGDDKFGLIYVLRRSRGDATEKSIVECRRCMWNVDALARSLALSHPGALVVLANPGALDFTTQYALFRAADVLLGVHGSAFGWAPFLTPTQAVVEIPMPGSPGLNDYMFATMGARTACEQACELRAPYGRECSSKGGDADLPLLLTTVRQLLARERNISTGQPAIVWRKLGERSAAQLAAVEDTRRRRAAVVDGSIWSIFGPHWKAHEARKRVVYKPRALSSA